MPFFMGYDSNQNRIVLQNAVAGSYSFTIRLTDAKGLSVDKLMVINVLAILPEEAAVIEEPIIIDNGPLENDSDKPNPSGTIKLPTFVMPSIPALKPKEVVISD